SDRTRKCSANIRGGLDPLLEVGSDRLSAGLELFLKRRLSGEMGGRRDEAKNNLKTVFLGQASASEAADADDEEDVTLHLAALCGDSEGLRHIAGEIHYSQWLNYRVRPYMSPPLRLAVSAGANPEGSRKNRCSPLLVAVRDGFSEGVKLLLQHGADPEPFNQICTCVPGWPLQHAIVYAHFSCYFELIKGGALANLTLLPYQVNPKVVTRLSIPHAILKYAKEYPEFMELYNECGGNLRQVNTAGTTCSEEFLDGSPAKDLLISLSGEAPI
ncbi:Ankyrin repeat and SOCS box protein 12-like, partial [Homarus americanus]